MPRSQILLLSIVLLLTSMGIGHSHRAPRTLYESTVRPATAEEIRTATAIRDRISADDSLSLLANAISFSLIGDRIALNGPVKNPKERCKIMVYAQNIAGWRKVKDEMSIQR